MRNETMCPKCQTRTLGRAPEKGQPIMAKLYKSTVHLNHWIASVPGLGWFMFPARENGWEERKPARGLDPLYLREVPAKLGENAGFSQYGHTPAQERSSMETATV
jgi:hypothetical protein